MTPEIQDLIKRRRVFYDVSPYYVIDEQRPVGHAVIMRRIQAGFDVTLYAQGAEAPVRLVAGDVEFQSTLNELERLAHEVVPESSGSSKITITPYHDELVIDTHRHLEPEAFVRIRITDIRDWTKPEGGVQEQTLSLIRKNLRELEVPEGSSI